MIHTTERLSQQQHKMSTSCWLDESLRHPAMYDKQWYNTHIYCYSHSGMDTCQSKAQALMTLRETIAMFFMLSSYIVLLLISILLVVTFFKKYFHCLSLKDPWFLNISVILYLFFQIYKDVGFEGSFEEFCEHLKTDPKFFFTKSVGY